MSLEEKLSEFIDYVDKLKGDEKGEAQLFCDRLFRAFGHGGIIEAAGELEARIKFSSTGTTKFADCLWSPDGRDGVLIEMKKSSISDLENHFTQARDYWIEMDPEKVLWPGAQKPRYIVLCNFRKFIIYRDLSLVDELSIDELEDRASALNFLLKEKREPIFKHNIEEISKKAARTIGDLYKHLVFDQNEEPELAQRYILQCVLSLFSEDFGLLPHYLFSELVRDCLRGASAYDLIGNLFVQMANPKRARGGRYKDVRYFNGGLFEAVDPIELDKSSLEILNLAGAFNWKQVNPAIFGALFESTMSSGDRHTFGAHFTSEVDILKIVNPTIIQPWNERLTKAKTLTELKKTLDDLSKFKVLDSACGCGNFLYASYQALKDYEMRVIEKIVDKYSASSIKKLGLGTSRISTRSFQGMDVLPIAVEVSKMGMMVAKEFTADKWNARIGPLLSTLGLSLEEGLPLDQLDDVITLGDAVFDDWPDCDAIIGNPPYQSKNKIQQEYGPTYTSRLREEYPDVPGRADYCVYWFKKAHDHLSDGMRAGLVGTNTIRQNYSREGGLDYIVKNGGTIFNAVSTQRWSGDASVDVSIVNWIKGAYKGIKSLSLQVGDQTDAPFAYYQLQIINSSLSHTVDVSEAYDLGCNSKPKTCYQGQTHGHKGFLLSPKEATALISKDPKNADVLKPFLTANDMLANMESQPKRFVINFGNKDVFEAMKYPDLFNIVESMVKPDRKTKADEEQARNNKALAKNPEIRVNLHHKNFYDNWWKLSYSRNDLMGKIRGMSRYISCSQVAKRSIFEFVEPSINPNAALIVFPFVDEYSFGILQSSIHWEWVKARCSTLTGRYRYTSNSVWKSFPWPQTKSAAKILAVEKAAQKLLDVRKKTLKENDLTLRELYQTMEESPSNKVTKAHEKLNAAVRSAYGMTGKTDVLASLLKLNAKIETKESEGKNVIGPGKPI